MITFSFLTRSPIPRLVLSALLSLLVMVLSTTWAEQPFSGRLQYAEGTYRINVGDMLSVNVYNQPDLSHNAILVRADGNASFNGIGEVQVAGKTLHEVTDLLESQLRELVRDPRITLSITESKPPAVYLAGAVMKPGLLQVGNNAGGTDAQGRSSANASNLRMDFRLSNVLAAAGGVQMNADLANIMISRNGRPYQTVNLWSMLKQGDTEADVMLQNGDSVYIPELPDLALDDETYRLLLSSSIGPRSFPVRVVGEIKTPGVYELDATSPYLNSLLAKGGGFNPGANKKVVALRRFSAENAFSTVFIDPNKHDFMLRPNDVIYVSELKVYKAGRFAEAVTKALSPFTNAASTAFGFAVLKGL